MESGCGLIWCTLLAICLESLAKIINKIANEIVKSGPRVALGISGMQVSSIAAWASFLFLNGRAHTDLTKCAVTAEQNEVSSLIQARSMAPDVGKRTWEVDRCKICGFVFIESVTERVLFGRIMNTVPKTSNTAIPWGRCGNVINECPSVCTV